MDRHAGFAVVIASVLLSPLAAQDPRNIRTGLEIPTETCADQPYVVQTDDGAWLCVLTTGSGPIAEEQSFAVLSDGAFYCIYRTTDGHPACSSSRDGGHTWSTPQYARYADGRLIKHPRAANFVWKCRNGKYLYWFHNHGGRTFDDRNPAWLCGGVEADSPEGKVIRWSQPEIVLYDDDPYIRMSYPDLIEDSNEFFLTETQKDIARVHPVPRDLLDGLWRQFENRSAVTKDLILDLPHEGRPMQPRIRAPRPPAFLARDGSRADQGAKDLRAGFAIDLWVTFESICPGDVLLDSRTTLWSTSTAVRRSSRSLLTGGSVTAATCVSSGGGVSVPTCATSTATTCFSLAPIWPVPFTACECTAAIFVLPRRSEIIRRVSDEIDDRRRDS